MSTPTEAQKRAFTDYKLEVDEALDRLQTACETLPYKFGKMESSFQRAIVRKLHHVSRVLAHHGSELTVEHLVDKEKSPFVVEMGVNDCVSFSGHASFAPTLDDLKTAFKENERVKFDFPAPVPLSMFDEDTFTADSGLMKTFVAFATLEECRKAISVGEFSFKAGEQEFTVVFRSALQSDERKDWAKIHALVRRLNAVQKSLVENKAVETNDAFPFQVEIPDHLVVDVNPAYLEKLWDLKDRVKQGDKSGLTLLDKTPVAHLEEVKEFVKELCEERIGLIMSLREFQGMGYKFTFDMLV